MRHAKLPNPKLGHISASCWSVEYNNPFSLAIVKDGKNMIGKKTYMHFHHLKINQFLLR